MGAVQTQLASVPESWEGTLLEPNVLGYVQESLVDIAAYAALENDKTQYCQSFPVLPEQTIVDASVPEQGPPGTPLDAPTCLQTAIDDTSAPIEASLATHILSGDFSLPAWQEDMGRARTPRRVRSKLKKHVKHVLAHFNHAIHVAETSGPQERGYKPRKKRGKPIDKRPTKLNFMVNSKTKIALVGPDFVGCSTVLQVLQ